MTDLDKAGSGSVWPEIFNAVVDALRGHEGRQITAAAIDSQAAQDGDVLTADGSGGAAWEVGGGSSNVPFVGVDPPGSPTDGMLWWDPDDDTPVNGGSQTGAIRLEPFGPIATTEATDDAVLLYTPTAGETVLGAIALPDFALLDGGSTVLAIGALGSPQLLALGSAKLSDSFSADITTFAATSGLFLTSDPIYCGFAENLQSGGVSRAWQPDTAYSADGDPANTYDVVAEGQLWFNAGAAGISGGSTPDFAGGGDVIDGADIVWNVQDDSPSPVGSLSGFLIVAAATS